MNIKKHLPWLGALLPVASMQAEKIGRAHV